MSAPPTAAIYISGLPATVGNIQLEDICKGVGKIKKIKVYRDAGGIPKGDALVVFDAKLNRDVAGDAVEELDGKEIDQGGLGSYVIAVQEAVFKEPRRPVIPQPPPMPAPAPAAPRSRGPVAAPPDCPKALLKNCFDATKLTARDTQLEDEVGYECTKHGRVIDAECLVAGGDAGSMLVSFTTVEAARRCCVAMHGRNFDGRALEAELWPQGSRPPPAAPPSRGPSEPRGPSASRWDRSASREPSVGRGPSEPPSPRRPPSPKRARYVGAPPPKMGDAPAPYVEPAADGPTRRLREPTLPPPPPPPPVGIQAFVKAAGGAEPDAPPPPSAKKRGRAAADFFDD